MEVIKTKLKTEERTSIVQATTKSPSMRRSETVPASDAEKVVSGALL